MVAMKKERKPLSPKRIENREKILAYVNAFLSLGTLVCGLIILSLVNDLAKAGADDVEVTTFLLLLFGQVCLVVVFVLSAIMEINAALFRREKRVLYESLPFAFCYLLLIISPFAIPNNANLSLVIYFSLFVLLNFVKLTYTHVAYSKDKGTITWTAILVLLILTGASFIMVLFLVRDNSIDLWTALALYLILSGFFLIFYSLFRKWSPKKLLRVIQKSHAAEILFGLVFMLIAVAISLSFIEPGMESILDALWYCFACITTIGFGDIVATTIVGRILSVFLGVYGIVVTAVVTSIIVNLYNDSRAEEEASKAAYLAEKQQKEEAEKRERVAAENEKAKRRAMEMLVDDVTETDRSLEDLPVERDIRDEGEEE